MISEVRWGRVGQSWAIPTLALPLVFQLSSVEAGGATAFIYANFSVPVVKVSGGLVPREAVGENLTF